MAVPTAAVDGAVNGACNGAVSTLGGGGTAVAGAAAAIGPDQLVPVLQQLVTALNGLVAALQPLAAGASGGGAAAAPTQTAAHDHAHAPAPSAPPAPAAAEVDTAKWVTGDVDGLNPELLKRLAIVGERMGEPVSVTSGHRSREEQEVLYQKYLDGTGNLAAKPGTSDHESGNAADVKIGGKSLALNQRALDIAHEVGLHFPVPGEPWHAEIT
jgi:hypothetical protein